jgi:hypothetical protein
LSSQPDAAIKGAKESHIANGKVGFVEPMLALAVTKLPEGAAWSYELKFDDYRALGLKTNGRVKLLSRNGKDFSQRFVSIARTLEALPDDTVIDVRSSRTARIGDDRSSSYRTIAARARAAPLRLRLVDASRHGSDAGTARKAAGDFARWGYAAVAGFNSLLGVAGGNADRTHRREAVVVKLVKQASVAAIHRKDIALVRRHLA